MPIYLYASEMYLQIGISFCKFSIFWEYLPISSAYFLILIVFIAISRCFLCVILNYFAYCVMLDWGVRLGCYPWCSIGSWQGDCIETGKWFNKQLQICNKYRNCLHFKRLIAQPEWLRLTSHATGQISP